MIRNRRKHSSVFNNSCLSIGVLIEGFADSYQKAVWAGIADATHARKANVLGFAGGALGRSPHNPWEYQRNMVYDLANPRCVDGLIISASLGSFVSNEHLQQFLERFRKTPAVSLTPASASMPAALVNNRQGMESHAAPSGCPWLPLIRFYQRS